MNRINKIILFVSLVAYLVIFLRGNFISMPLILWLPIASVSPDSQEQLYAIIGSVGFILCFTKYFKYKIVQGVSFLMLLTPIIQRLISVSVIKFAYFAFYMPFLIFLIAFSAFLILNRKHAYLSHNW